MTIAFGNRDRAELERLLEHYAPLVLKFGRKLCGDGEDARDVLQDTLLAASQNLDEFRGDAALSTWLYSVARSFCIRRRRTSKFAPRVLDSIDDEAVRSSLSAPEPEPDEALAHEQMRQLLEKAVASLPDDYREILILRDAEERPAAEVASMLGISIEAAKSRLHRARSAVGDALRALGEGPA